MLTNTKIADSMLFSDSFDSILKGGNFESQKSSFNLIPDFNKGNARVELDA